VVRDIAQQSAQREVAVRHNTQLSQLEKTASRIHKSFQPRCTFAFDPPPSDQIGGKPMANLERRRFAASLFLKVGAT
jgi:hypothetical protein